MLKHSLFFVAAISLFACAKKIHTPFSSEGNEKEALQAYYKKLLADPKTAQIPAQIRLKELAFAQTLPAYYSIKRADDIWKLRGPNNQGGRTRALAYDVQNTSVLLAGSATGGIYKSTDGGNHWFKTVCPANAITCIVQDCRAGKTNIWYAGTGELSGSSGTATGAYYLGMGLLKSTDGGEHWSILSATAGGSSTAFDSDFDGVWNIVLDSTNHTQDEVYAATYGGIWKSLDGGNTWKKKRSGALPNYSYYTDVAIDKNGVVYGTLSSESTHKGIWRSVDGETWVSILPSGFPSAYGRICIGIAPSDPNQVHFVATNTTNAGFVSTNFQGTKEWNSLWKYDYLSGNGSGTGGRWINKSQNLPAKGGDFGYYSTQGGYDLYIRIHPSDTNLVFIGATNLWRSRDAFRSNTKTDWIGGYAVNTFRPDFKLYPNHHPDNHNMVFLPDLSACYSSHDGGISYTNNVLADSVIWSFKNNDYISSQFYTIALDHGIANDHKIVGGLQDNGTQFMNGYGKGSWEMSFNGDGSYCQFFDSSSELLVSAQQGRIAHVSINAIGVSTAFARIDPLQLSRDDYDFINPFTLDPNNQNRLYLPTKKFIYRNLDVKSKPLGSSFDSSRWDTPLWEEMSNCTPLTGQEFSSIAMSKAQANTLYFGTDKGRLYKLYNAHTGQSVPKDITGSNFSTGNINCIALDPSDSNSITVVFSNYNVISLYHSDDAGNTWANISGNLEENPNGSGSGPSCRWANIVTLNNGRKAWFIGTSVGLYSTDTLNGINTRWIQQSPNGIGNNIVTMIDVRSKDNCIAVATHGNGAYSANIAQSWQISDLEIETKATFSIYPNPSQDGICKLALSQAISPDFDVELMNVLGQTMAKPKWTNLNNQTVQLELPSIEKGQYIIQIKNQNQVMSQFLFIR
jgi:photosystem II stability/assembly factor-like uncharacterized protein